MSQRSSQLRQFLKDGTDEHLADELELLSHQTSVDNDMIVKALAILGELNKRQIRQIDARNRTLTLYLIFLTIALVVLGIPQVVSAYGPWLSSLLSLI
jgi:hypothetical protein